MPLIIKETEAAGGAGTDKRLELSGFEARALARLFVSLEDKNTAPEVRVINASSKNLTVEKPTELRGRIERTVTNLVAATITTEILGFVILYVSSRLLLASDQKFHGILEESSQKFREDSEKMTNKIDESEAKFNRMHGEVNRTSERLQKHNIMLLARISDLSKEITFWRDTIRKMMYTVGQRKDEVEGFLRSVSSSLGTQSTHANSGNFDSIMLLSKMLTSTHSEETPAQE
jgi:hypothetical protein